MALDKIKGLMKENIKSCKINKRRLNEEGVKMNLDYEKLSTIIQKHIGLVIMYALFIVTITLIFSYYKYSIDTYITVLLTFILAVSTLYYAIVSSNTFKLLRLKEIYDLKPSVDWRIFKTVKKLKDTDKQEIILEILENVQ